MSCTPPPLMPIQANQWLRVCAHLRLLLGPLDEPSGPEARLTSARCNPQAWPYEEVKLSPTSTAASPAPPNATGSCHLSTSAQIDGRVCCTGTRSTWGVPGTPRQYGRLARCSPCRCAGVPPGQLPVSEVPRFPYVGLHAALNRLLSSLLLPPNSLQAPICGPLGRPQL